MSRTLPDRIQRWIEIAVFTLVLCMLAWFASFLNSMPKAKGPHGEMFPTLIPDEKNRVVHTTGFSIIAPENWDELNVGIWPNQLQIAARGIPGRRLKAMITVTRWDEKPDSERLEKILAPCTRITFQNMPAWEYCRVTKPYDKVKSECDIYFERDQAFWSLHFLVADKITVLPQSVRQYLESFGTNERDAANSDVGNQLPGKQSTN